MLKVIITWLYLTCLTAQPWEKPSNFSKRGNYSLLFIMRCNNSRLWQYLLLCLALHPGLLSAQSSSLNLPALSATQVQWLGQQIFQNECNSRPACLTSWNEGENFPSFGIGHFIWYQAGQQEIYTESFPALLTFMQQRGIAIPAWIKATNFKQPWTSRTAFLAAQQDNNLIELRTILTTHMELQTDFIISRFDHALELVLATVPTAEQQEIKSKFINLANSQVPNGIYALIDYINFKGEGTNPSERYQGQGWGLLQVLQGMPTATTTPLEDFVKSAQQTLVRRVANAPEIRHEQRWMEGWNKRLLTYLPTTTQARIGVAR